MAEASPGSSGRGRWSCRFDVVTSRLRDAVPRRHLAAGQSHISRPVGDRLFPLPQVVVDLLGPAGAGSDQPKDRTPDEACQ